MKNRFTAKQHAFIEEYLVDLNATQAAIRAGYSERTAKEIGCENLSKPHIQKAIRVAVDERSQRTEITVDRVLTELAKIGFSDIRVIYTDSDKLHSITDLPDNVAAAVQSVEAVIRPTGETDDEGNRKIERVYKVRLADKLKGLEVLCKHLGMFDHNRKTSQGVFNILLNYGGDKEPIQVGNYVADDG